MYPTAPPAIPPNTSDLTASAWTLAAVEDEGIFLAPAPMALKKSSQAISAAIDATAPTPEYLTT
jgi:hypothetical protein